LASWPVLIDGLPSVSSCFPSRCSLPQHVQCPCPVCQPQWRLPLQQQHHCCCYYCCCCCCCSSLSLWNIHCQLAANSVLFSSTLSFFSPRPSSSAYHHADSCSCSCCSCFCCFLCSCHRSRRRNSMQLLDISLRLPSTAKQAKLITLHNKSELSYFAISLTPTPTTHHPQLAHFGYW